MCQDGSRYHPVKIDPETNTLVREGVPFITNPFDTHAVEEALRLKDRYGAHVPLSPWGPHLQKLCCGEPFHWESMTRSFLSDRVFGGADTLATSSVITEAIVKLNEKEPVDLVICGKQTIDGDTAQVGPGIASRLNFSQLTLVDNIQEIDEQKKIIRIQRKLEEHHEIVESTLPALITVEREINTPRYPTVLGRLDAEEAQMPVWNNGFLKLDPKTIGLQGSPARLDGYLPLNGSKVKLFKGKVNIRIVLLKTCLINSMIGILSHLEIKHRTQIFADFLGYIIDNLIDLAFLYF